MVKIVKGNILNATEDIICHQVNCMGIMGAGLAKQIKYKYPEVFKAYKELCNFHKDDLKFLLGKILKVDCHDGKKIVNMFGQYNYGTNSIQTNYTALENCFKKLFEKVSNINNLNKTVAIPYKIGCGLAGGDWNVVFHMIEKVSEEYKCDVTIYELN